MSLSAAGVAEITKLMEAGACTEAWIQGPKIANGAEQNINRAIRAEAAEQGKVAVVGGYLCKEDGTIVSATHKFVDPEVAEQDGLELW